jgi:hypothetical protein
MTLHRMKPDAIDTNESTPIIGSELQEVLECLQLIVDGNDENESDWAYNMLNQDCDWFAIMPEYVIVWR